MTYVSFLTSLFEEGRVVVPDDEPTAEQMQAGAETIAAYEKAWRSSLPGSPPEMAPSAAQWAAMRFFRACQFTVYRDADAETIERELNEPLTGETSPAVCYSVDLIFRYLPDLAKFAATASEHDPLVSHLYRWAHEWPLSSVGMSKIDDVAIDAFADHASLMQLYVDRVIATGDKSRLTDQRVRQAARAALGIYSQLNETISKALKEHAQKA